MSTMTTVLTEWVMQAGPGAPQLAVVQESVSQSSQAIGHAVAAAPAADNNPWSGIKPNFGVLGDSFDAVWKRVAGAAWALALAVTGAMLLRGIVTYGQSRNSYHPTQVAEASQEMKQGGIAFGAVAAFGVVLGAVLFVIRGGG